MPTISQIITNGELSVPLSANYNDRKKLFGGAISSPKSPVLIKIVTDALNWMNDDGGFTDAELASVGNYLVWLCGRFGLEAAGITGSGGSVTPIAPGGSSGVSRQDFIVSASSYIVTGATSVTLSDYISYEIDFIRNGISQSQVTSEPSYIVWTKATGALTISPALAESELITIIPS
jgi:hypothetical protein